MGNPLVSIVLANLNGAQFLGEALESVIAQSFSNWELIAIDSGSTDGSPDLLQSWAHADPRIRPLLLKELLNYPAAINEGLRMSRGAYIARLESDDIWLKHKLERQIQLLKALESSNIGVCGSDAMLMNSEGEIVGCKRFPRTHEACIAAIWYRNPLCHSAIVARREIFETVGEYDESKFLVEDLDLWFRVMRFWRFANIPEPLMQYRVWQGSLTDQKMREIARLTRKLRREAKEQHGVRFSWKAWVVYLLSYGAGIIPPQWVRHGFQWFVDKLDHENEKVTSFQAKLIKHTHVAEADLKFVMKKDK
jgi:glycosyltransferase involved in cell wall biosynthesis